MMNIQYSFCCSRIHFDPNCSFFLPFLGDIVSLSIGRGTTAEDGIASGVVTSVTSTSIYISFEESVDDLSLAEDESYKLIKLANDVTYKRLKRYFLK